ncbi:hypothetical protein AN963_16655 [Brevibacillus choshinensis]|uniref:Uncharacterized protein n=1 Tax=Brevibacillus choshinensis TaxID=54911 RepID=A0ABR5N7E7_BRECH|nr:hypothetical protein [Brevibacillus choshinensis]KQL46552.1 hypothetical protein AN963_16655 [Brevibacillus choshinensis]
MESNDRVEVISDLFREGHSAEEIADLLGYKGKGGVSGYMRRHGYRWDWGTKNYVRDPLMKISDSSISMNPVLAINKQQTPETNSNIQVHEQDTVVSSQQEETIYELQDASQFHQTNNLIALPIRDFPKKEDVLPIELIQNLKEILQHKDKLMMMVTDQPKDLYMKRYKGPAITKTVQIQAQLSERLTGFVNNTGYTVKDVMNKAVEDFLQRYGG